MRSMTFADFFRVLLLSKVCTLRRRFPGIGRIVIAGLQNPDCIPFWWIAPGFEIHSKKQDLIADWIASYFQFLQSNPDCNPFLGQLVMSDIFPILIGLE